MNKKIYLVILSIFCMINANAQTSSISSKPKKKIVDVTSGIEGSILQFSNFTIGNSKINTIPRYSYFFNSGSDINFKINKKVYPFTGIYLKNIGMIDKYDSIRIKRRMYTIGAPIGLKLALNKKLSLKLGADFNLVFNYKEKLFINGDKKDKYNEFFSKRTPLFYPSIFFGLKYSFLSITANYYPNNFFNTKYEHTANYFPFANYDSKIFSISFGFNYDNMKMKKNAKK